MNDVVDTELVHRLRRQYGGAVRDPDLSTIRARARHLQRRRRRTALAATAVVAASASAVTFALVSTDGDDTARLSTEVPPSSVADSTTITTKPVAVEGAARPHSQVKVLVASGSGRDGHASRMHADLVTLGYSSLGAENARPLPLSTVIYYRDSYREDAKQLATTIGAPETLVQPMPESLGERLEPPVVVRAQVANVVIILGNEATPFQATSSTTVGTMIPSTSRGV